MTFSFLRTPRCLSEADRRDTGAAVIVVMMMTLVFVPIVLAHLAAVYQGNLANLVAGQIASFMHMLAPAAASY